LLPIAEELAIVRKKRAQLEKVAQTISSGYTKKQKY
jgi:hypothetical protein